MSNNQYFHSVVSLRAARFPFSIPQIDIPVNIRQSIKIFKLRHLKYFRRRFQSEDPHCSSRRLALGSTKRQGERGHRSAGPTASALPSTQPTRTSLAGTNSLSPQTQLRSGATSWALAPEFWGEQVARAAEYASVPPQSG